MKKKEKRSVPTIVIVLGVGTIGFCCLGGTLVTFLIPGELSSNIEEPSVSTAREESPREDARGGQPGTPLAIPDDLDLNILESSTVGALKRSLTVRLSRRVSESELHSIAQTLKAEEDKDYERTFIVYLLPDMQVGAGAWATTHFNPNLEVKILGLTADQESTQVEESEALPGEHLGRWIDNTPFTGGVIVIYRNEGKLFVHSTLAAGGELTREVTKRRVGRETRYEIADNDFGEYYVIHAGGDLGIYDREGLITTARARQ